MRRLFNHFILLSFLFVTKVTVATAQTESVAYPQMKTISPPSPNAASFEKFGEYPVTLYNGLINISIPIYQIQTSSLSLPISVDYHASGIKVTDVASWVGLGWALNAGGAISRSIMGLADESTDGYLSTDNEIRGGSLTDWQTSQDDINYLENIALKMTDPEPDIFSYNFPGKSGHFVFNRNKVSVITQPLDNIQVSWSFNTTTNHIDLFTVVDEKGNTYRFGRTLSNYDRSESSETYDAFSGTTSRATSSWQLTSIISADKQDTISFKYFLESVSAYTDVLDYWIIKDEHEVYTNTPVYNSDIGVKTSGYITTGTDEYKLSEIDFKNGKILFNQSSDNRLDRANSKKLQSIVVYNYDAISDTYSKIKTYQFFQSYYHANDRLRFDSLQTVDNSGSIIGTYKFTYNSTNLPSPTDRNRDLWGYYNTNPGTSLVPQTTIDYYGDNGGPLTYRTIGDANRDPDTARMQACVLQKIYYPTGGRDEFTYETNRYLSGSNILFAGGLRIKQVKSYDSISPTPMIATYTYGQNESGNGILNIPSNSTLNPSIYTSSIISQHWDAGDYMRLCANETIRMRTYSTNSNIDLVPYDGSPVYYDYVTEYKGTPSASLGKTVYHYQFFGDINDEGLPGGSNKVHRQSYYWKRGTLQQERIYNSAGSPLAETDNYYNTHNSSFYDSTGLIFNVNFDREGGVPNNLSTTDPDIDGNVYCYQGLHLFGFASYDIQTGNFQLDSSVQKTFDQNDSTKYISKTTSYVYDVSSLQPSKITETLSNGDKKVMQIKYPGDYTLTGSNLDDKAAGIKNLVTSNILTFPVETYEQRTSSTGSNIRTTKGVLTSFEIDNPYPDSIFRLENAAALTDFAPSSVSGNNFSKDSRYEPAVAFKYESHGNIVQQSKISDVKYSYIWDYGNALPIAEVKNSPNTTIAYTSFEADGYGHWSYSTDSIKTDNNAVTGANSYNLSSNHSISLNSNFPLSTTDTFVVSYWSKSASWYTVQGNISGSERIGKKIGDWTYFEHLITGVTTTSIAGFNGIDELRLYPKHAQMTTYTYDPLVGITSQCDINNKVFYYEYDDFARLSLIRDQDHNIIKKYCYNYAGQQTNCDVNLFYNVADTGFYKRLGCQSGYVGTVAPYIVKAGKYNASNQLTADGLAQSDVSSNAQSYANTNGTCIVDSVGAIKNFNQSSIQFTIVLTALTQPPQTQYSFTLSASGSGAVVGTVPPGTYDIKISSPGNTTPYPFEVKSYDDDLFTSGSSLFLYNVNVSRSTPITINNP